MLESFVKKCWHHQKFYWRQIFLSFFISLSYQTGFSLLLGKSHNRKKKERLIVGDNANSCLLNTHYVALSLFFYQDPLVAIPREGTLIYDRALLVFTFLLQYCVDLLCWQENDQLPFPLTMMYVGFDSSFN